MTLKEKIISMSNTHTMEDFMKARAVLRDEMMSPAEVDQMFTIYNSGLFYDTTTPEATPETNRDTTPKDQNI